MNTQEFVKQYQQKFNSALENISAFESTTAIAYAEAVSKCVTLVNEAQKNGKKVMMIGNGGSAGIASHMTVDYWKNGGIKATAFNDSSLLTCISNDFSYSEVFSKPVEMFGEKGDILFCISSSGNSENIIKAAQEAKKKSCTVVTFSGFDKTNKLIKEGSLNFHVDSHSYGFVEIIHNLIIHCILDAKLYCTDGINIFNKNTKL
jgi:D-sedoheptulose 7-phosphate isomerase